jgi:hypothetical protein
MAETARRRTSPWVAFLAGAVVMLALLLGWTAWNKTREAPRRLGVALNPPLPHVPVPRPPDAPMIPKPPIPKPQ